MKGLVEISMRSANLSSDNDQVEMNAERSMVPKVVIMNAYVYHNQCARKGHWEKCPYFIILNSFDVQQTVQKYIPVSNLLI